MSGVEDLVAKAIRSLGAKPSDDAPSPTKKGYSEKFSAAMATAAARALRGADTKNIDEVLKAGDEIAAICEACHEPYRDGRRMGPPPVK